MEGRISSKQIGNEAVKKLARVSRLRPPEEDNYGKGFKTGFHSGVRFAEKVLFREASDRKKQGYNPPTIYLSEDDISKVVESVDDVLGQHENKILRRILICTFLRNYTPMTQARIALYLNLFPAQVASALNKYWEYRNIYDGFDRIAAQVGKKLREKLK